MPTVTGTVTDVAGSGTAVHPATVTITLVGQNSAGTIAPVVGYYNGREIAATTVVTADQFTGVWSVTVPSNADPALSPSNTMYRVVEQPFGQTAQTYYISVPNGAGPYVAGNFVANSAQLASYAITVTNLQGIPVDPTTPTSNQVLKYNSTTGKWAPGTGGGGGSSSPLTTKGDLWGFDTADDRVPVGANGTVLTADSTQPLGLKWSAAPVTSVAGKTGAVTLAEADVANLTTDLAARLVAANNLSDVANAATARTNLGLGSAATQAAGTFAQVANNLSDLANAATARTNLGLGTAATQASSAFVAAGVDATSAGTVTAIRGKTVSATAPTDAQLLLWNNTNSDWEPHSLSGDATVTNTGVVTLKNTGTAGTVGDASHSVTVTTDAQGRVTAATQNAIQIAESQL